MGSPVLRNSTPPWMDGRNPREKLDDPRLAPRPELRTTKPGKFCDSLPSPWLNHDPMVGRPTRGLVRPDVGWPRAPSLDSAIRRGKLDPRARKWVRPRLRRGASHCRGAHCAQELLKPASISRRNRLEILAISSPLGSN